MLNPRLDRLRDYPFQRLRALLDPIPTPAGLKTINLSIGEPNQPYPDFVAEILDANRHLYGIYPPANGSAELRQAIAAWLDRRYHLPAGMIDPDRHVLPLAGTREGLFMIAEVVVPERKGGGQPIAAMPNPFYQAYVGAAVMAGAEPLYLPALPENGFLPDLDALDKATLDRVAMLYLCTPSNPQGTIASIEYLEKAIGLARAHDFALIVDECYAEIYADAPPPGGLEACARLGGDMTNVLVFHSLSKRSSVPGLRSGFCAGDPALIAAFTKLRNYAGAPSTPATTAAAAALWRDEAHVEATRAAYAEKFSIAESIIGNRYGFYKPAGGFYLWLDVGDSEDAARQLWAKGGVRCLPGLYLTKAETEAGADAGLAAGKPFIRLALVHDAATIRQAMERLRDALG